MKIIRNTVSKTWHDIGVVIRGTYFSTQESVFPPPVSVKKACLPLSRNQSAKLSNRSTLSITHSVWVPDSSSSRYLCTIIWFECVFLLGVQNVANLPSKTRRPSPEGSVTSRSCGPASVGRVPADEKVDPIIQYGYQTRSESHSMIQHLPGIRIVCLVAPASRIA